jgi:hypothetical protein
MRMRTRKQGKSNYTNYWNLPHALYMIMILKTVMIIVMIKIKVGYLFDALLE